MLGKGVVYLLSRTSLGDLARPITPLQALYRDHFWSKPNRPNRFFGVYQSHQEAKAAVPQRLQTGWDHDDLVASSHFQPSIYPTLYWLSRVITARTQLIDFGGAVGQTYEALAQRLPLPADLRWVVVDVAAAVRRGRARAAELDLRHLSFTDNINELARCDVFLSRGCLQYVEATLESLLTSLPALPPYVLIDKIAFTDGPDFWTLQNLAASASPYRIFNRSAFLAPLLSLGYTVRDTWPASDLSASIPFHPRLHVAAFSGLFLERSR